MAARPLPPEVRDRLTRAVDAEGGAAKYAAARDVSPATVARACAGFALYPSTAKAVLKGLDVAPAEATA